jgi:hypothetical protein
MPGIFEPTVALHGDSPHGRIMNRNPRTSTQYSRAVVVGGPQIRPGNNEVGQDWTPYGTRPTHPYLKQMPYSLMAVSQATGFYNSAVNTWPANGQADYPNGQQTHPHMHLQPTTSAHLGFTNPTGPNPNMVFISPPVFGFQTKPLFATGL